MTEPTTTPTYDQIASLRTAYELSLARARQYANPQTPGAVRAYELAEARRERWHRALVARVGAAPTLVTATVALDELNELLGLSGRAA